MKFLIIKKQQIKVEAPSEEELREAIQDDWEIIKVVERGESLE